MPNTTYTGQDLAWNQQPGDTALYFTQPTVNGLVEAGDSNAPQFKKLALGSAIYLGDGVHIGYALKHVTTAPNGNVAFGDGVFGGQTHVDANGRITLQGTGSQDGVSLTMNQYLVGQPGGTLFYVILEVTNNSGSAFQMVPTMILPDMNMQNFRGNVIGYQGSSDTDAYSYDATNKYLQVTTPNISNMYLGIKACASSQSYYVQNGYYYIGTPLATGDLSNSIGTLGSTNYVFMMNGTTANAPSIAAGATQRFAWAIGYAATQSALQATMAAITAPPTTDLTTDTGYYSATKLSAVLPGAEPVQRMLGICLGRVTAMAHSQTISGKKNIPAGSYTFIGAFGRDGYYGVKSLLQVAGMSGVVSDEFALFLANQNSSPVYQQHEVWNYVGSGGLYVASSNNGTPGDQDPYMILKGYEYYVATQDSAWLTANIASLNAMASYLSTWYASNKDAGGDFAGNGTSTYLDGEGNVSGANPVVDPVLVSLVAYAFQRLSELNTIAGNTSTAASQLSTATTMLANFSTAMWNSSASWPYMNRAPGGTYYTLKHLAKVDVGLWSTFDSAKCALMATDLVDTSTWWQSANYSFTEVPATDPNYVSTDYWYGNGWHLTDFKAIEFVLRYGTPAQAQKAWNYLTQICLNRMDTLHGMLGEHFVNSGTFTFSSGALVECIVRGLFGIDAHASYFTINPNIWKIKGLGTFQLNNLVMGGQTYTVTVNGGYAKTVTANGTTVSGNIAYAAGTAIIVTGSKRRGA